ncbi:MAG TPA: TauD/TfdA family dioxygenase [Micromonosporaceae bacterium]|nr:TauD/TfdA family dioxygenase [Micromonosporaceae bacterium]
MRPDPSAFSPAGPAAHLLGKAARSLAAGGATVDRVAAQGTTPLPDGLTGALAQAVSLPERRVGWRVVRGLLAGFDEPGPTPAHWMDAVSPRTHAFDLALLLTATALGRVFGWRGQQDGRLIHNILPSRGHERMQVGASSTAELLWHTEDAFHPRRAELLLLACVRNEDGVGSRVASVRQARLGAHELAALSRRRVAILPDDSYAQRSDAGDAPAAVRTVWWAADGPCLRYDPSYARRYGDDAEFEAAYAALGRALDECGSTVALDPGDVLLIDNDVAVHGRLPFQPRYDGTDRWLKRLLVRLPRPRPPEEAAEDGYGQLLVEPDGPVAAGRLAGAVS